MHIRVFREGCRSPDDPPKAHRSKPSGSPDARSLESSAHFTIEVSGRLQALVFSRFGVILRRASRRRADPLAPRERLPGGENPSPSRPTNPVLD
jgi:hypothetical protein